MKPYQERLIALLKDTIMLVCRNGLRYDKEFCVEGLLGVTLDKDDVFLISINQLVTDESKNDDISGMVGEGVNTSDGGTNQTYSSKSDRSRKRRRHEMSREAEGCENQQGIITVFKQEQQPSNDNDNTDSNHDASATESIRHDPSDVKSEDASIKSEAFSNDFQDGSLDNSQLINKDKNTDYFSQSRISQGPFHPPIEQLLVASETNDSCVSQEMPQDNLAGSWLSDPGKANLQCDFQNNKHQKHSKDNYSTVSRDINLGGISQEYNDLPDTGSEEIKKEVDADFVNVIEIEDDPECNRLQETEDMDFFSRPGTVQRQSDIHRASASAPDPSDASQEMSQQNPRKTGLPQHWLNTSLKEEKCNDHPNDVESDVPQTEDCTHDSPNSSSVGFSTSVVSEPPSSVSKEVKTGKKTDCPEGVHAMVSSDSNLKIHVHSARQKPHHVCTVCGRKYSDREKLRIHIQCVHQRIVSVCKLCGAKFPDRSNLSRHFQRLHKKIKYTCDVCKREFSNICYLKKHAQYAHNQIL